MVAGETGEMDDDGKLEMVRLDTEVLIAEYGKWSEAIAAAGVVDKKVASEVLEKEDESGGSGSSPCSAEKRFEV